MLYSIYWPNFSVWLPLLIEILDNMCNAIVCLTRFWPHTFWNWHYLSNEAVFLHDQEVKTKIYISWQRKKISRWNKKHFSSYLKGFQLPKIIPDLRVNTTNKPYSTAEMSKKIKLHVVKRNIDSALKLLTGNMENEILVLNMEVLYTRTFISK